MQHIANITASATNAPLDAAVLGICGPNGVDDGGAHFTGDLDGTC